MKAAAPPPGGLFARLPFVHRLLQHLADGVDDLGGERGREGAAVADAFLGLGVDAVDPADALVAALPGDERDMVVRQDPQELAEVGGVATAGFLEGLGVDEVAVGEDDEGLPVLETFEDFQLGRDQGGFLALQRGDGMRQYAGGGDDERVLVDGGDAESEGVGLGRLLDDLAGEFDEAPGGRAANLGLLEAAVLGELGQAGRVEVAAEDHDELEVRGRRGEERGVLRQRRPDGEGFEVATEDIAQARVLDGAEGFAELLQVFAHGGVGLHGRGHRGDELLVGLLARAARGGHGNLGPDVGRGGEALGDGDLGLGLAAADEQQEREDGEEAAHGVGLGGASDG